MKLPLIDSATLTDAAALEKAWEGWGGAIACAAGETSLAPDLHLAPAAPVDPVEFTQEHALIGPVQPLGCHFLKDITFTGMLYPFQGDELLDDGSHLSMVSAEWLGRFPTHRPGMGRSGVTRILVDPVIPVAGPGHMTFGHWIIDFLPRLAVARSVLGERFRDIKFLLLNDATSWAFELMTAFFGIRRADCIQLEPGVDEFLCHRVCYPTFAHSYPFLLHSFLREFYQAFGPAPSPQRRLCIQRRTGTGDHRAFERRAVFEEQARREGFELVDPQGLSIREQAALFSTASTVIGEYGSALHNSVFCAEGTLFGVLNAPGVEQTRLCAAFHQPIAYMPSGNRAGSWSLSNAQLSSFFGTIRGLESDFGKPSFSPSALPGPLAADDSSGKGPDGLQGVFRAETIYGTKLAFDHATRELVHARMPEPGRSPALVYLPARSRFAFILFDNPDLHPFAPRHHQPIGPIIVARRRIMPEGTVAFSHPHELSYLIAHDAISPDGIGMAAFFGPEVAEWQHFRLEKLLEAELAQSVRRQIALIERVLPVSPTEIPDLLRAAQTGDRAVLAALLAGTLTSDDAELLADHLLGNSYRLKELATLMPTDPWATVGLPALQQFLQKRRSTAALLRPSPGMVAERPAQMQSTLTLGTGLDRLATDGMTGDYGSFAHHCAAVARRAVAPLKTLCVVATALNEGLYLLDWLAYHTSVGVERVILYTNDNNDGSDRLLRALAAAGEITLIESSVAPAVSPQSKASGHALSMLPEVLDYRWCAMIDLDELIGFDRSRFLSMQEYLEWQELRPVDTIALNWLVFGSGRAVRWRDESLPYRFVNRYLDPHIKTIFRPRKFHHATPHYPRTDGSIMVASRDAAGRPYPSATPRSASPVDGFAWIAHYFFRSFEEFIWKWSRGRGDDALEAALPEFNVPASFMADFVRQHHNTAFVHDDRMSACAASMRDEVQRLMRRPGVADAMADIRGYYKRRSAALADAVRQLRQTASPEAAEFYDILLAEKVAEASTPQNG